MTYDLGKIRVDALDDINDERDRQDAKWGVQNHPASVWLTVLTEEVGELAEAVLVVRGEPRDLTMSQAIADMRKEAVQSAAVAMAFVEWIDRGMPLEVGE